MSSPVLTNRREVPITVVLVVLIALLVGVVAGLRSLTPPALVAWGAHLGWLDVDGTWSHWLAYPALVAVLTILLVVELITDQLPKTPSRKSPLPFATRILTGAFAGAVIGSASLHTLGALEAGILGAFLGIVGAVLGTLGGYQARTRLVAANGGHDLPVALAEDAVAVLGGLALIALLRQT